VKAAPQFALVRVRKRILALTATGHKIAGTALSGRIGPG
jgi:hypothetical protein